MADPRATFEFKLKEKRCTLFRNKILGTGSYSTVFSAHYDNKKVAVKCSKNSSSAFNFALNEYHLVKELAEICKNNFHDEKSTYIVQFFGGRHSIGQNNVEKMFLVYEFMDAGSLYDWRSNIQAFNWTIGYSIIKNTIDGLVFLHEYNYVHCDVKPQNILLENTDNHLRAKISDFGLSAKSDKTCSVGTPIYLAPEVLNGEKNSEKSDVYALGSTLYFMQAGQENYTKDKQDIFPNMAALRQHLVTEDKRANLPSDTPDKIARMITMFWQKKDERPLMSTCQQIVSTDINDISAELAQYIPKTYT